jgi:hypothetical protein
MTSAQVDLETKAETEDRQHVLTPNVPKAEVAKLRRARPDYVIASKDPITEDQRKQAEAAVFGATYTWLRDLDWAPIRYGQRQAATLDGLVDEAARVLATELAPSPAADADVAAWRAWLLPQRARLGPARPRQRDGR